MLEYLIFLVSMSYTPGPNVILSTANASQKGFPRCLVLCLGMASGITVITSICYFAVTYLISLVSQLEILLKACSVVYLSWLAWSLFKKGAVGSTEETGGFVKGFYLQFLNVKLYMLCVSSTASFVLPMDKGLFGGWMVSLLIPFVCFSALVIWSLFGVAIRKVYVKHTKLLNSIFGLSLAYLAISNLVSLISIL